MFEKCLPNINGKALCIKGNALGIQEKIYSTYAEGAHRQTDNKKSCGPCCDADKDRKLWRHTGSSYHTGNSILSGGGNIELNLKDK